MQVRQEPTLVLFPIREKMQANILTKLRRPMFEETASTYHSNFRFEKEYTDKDHCKTISKKNEIDLR